jgi:hypothetical protein
MNWPTCAWSVSGLRRLSFALATAVALPSCTTYIQPVECGDEERKCGERHDVKFCENVVRVVEGADCAKAGLVAGKTFCFVSLGRCVSTRYALKDQDCRVLEYDPQREWYACSRGTPTFVP